ncbi:hypothetical protein MTR_7g053320 [Medicago truncatula]|uniref:Uncharacterized protein n=1 Tax=Medicago truncatula TaxID=3880 RepID=A0A072U080_MEDTR|nr:hypothetical protein MTR_7g053320 [Medicago truncatula]
MNKRFYLTTQGVQEGEWKPMKVGRNGPLISHLMFANHLFLFAHAMEEHIRFPMKKVVVCSFVEESSKEVGYNYLIEQAVTEAIPTHSMLTTATAKSSLQEIQSSFIWGDDDNRHHFHSVNRLCDRGNMQGMIVACK